MSNLGCDIIKIPSYLFQNATVHKSLTPDAVNGILSCGFLVKPTDRFSHDVITFSHYGAFLLLSGSGVYSDSHGRKTELTPGCFVQRMPGEPHITEVTGDGKWLEFFVCFGRDFYEFMARQGLLSRNPVLFHPLTESLLQRCISLLERFRTVSDRQIFSLFLSAQEFVMALTNTAQNEQFERWDRKMAQACALLCASDYPSPVEVAEKIGMQYETFRKRFKAAFLCSPSAYQMQYRLNDSKRLLLDSNMTIGEIAWQCRFADAFSYSKAFHKYYGLSPTQFRKISV